MKQKKSILNTGRSLFALSFGDIWKSILILVLATLIGFFFYGCGFTEANIIAVYILGVLIISVVTTHRHIVSLRLWSVC